MDGWENEAETGGSSRLQEGRREWRNKYRRETATLKDHLKDNMEI